MLLSQSSNVLEHSIRYKGNNMTESPVLLSNKQALKRVKDYMQLAVTLCDDLLQDYPEEGESLYKISATLLAPDPESLDDRLFALFEQFANWQQEILTNDRMWSLISDPDTISKKIRTITYIGINVARAYELSTVINWGEFKKK